METVTTAEESLEQILAADELDEATRSELRAAFFLINPLELARMLHTVRASNSVKSQILALKVVTPQMPRESAMERVVAASMADYWRQIGDAAREER